MSESTEAAEQVEGQHTDGNNGGETSTTETPINLTQEEFKRQLDERLKRERAKYADYNDLKSKATQFDAIAEAQKTELQRITERAEAAEQRAAALESRQQVADWKAEIAQQTGVPASVLRGNTQEDLLAHAESLKSLLPDPNARRSAGGYVGTEGRPVAPGTGDPRQQFADILKQA